MFFKAFLNTFIFFSITLFSSVIESMHFGGEIHPLFFNPHCSKARKLFGWREGIDGLSSRGENNATYGHQNSLQKCFLNWYFQTNAFSCSRSSATNIASLQQDYNNERCCARGLWCRAPSRCVCPAQPAWSCGVQHQQGEGPLLVALSARVLWSQESLGLQAGWGCSSCW